MLKTTIIAVFFFILGVVGTELYRNHFMQVSVDNNTQSAVQKDANPSESASNLNQKNETNLAVAVVQQSSKKTNLKTIKAPNTRFDFFNLLISLDSYSAKELEEYLDSLPPDKTEMRYQVSWLLAGKYPEDTLRYLSTVINRNDMVLAKSLFHGVAENHAKIVWDWLKTNETEQPKS